MRDDLLDAKACIIWANSKVIDFQVRIKSWLDNNFVLTLKDMPSPSTDRLIVVLQKEALPRDVNVEAGALINKIRSSLDLLATSLAHRHDVPNPDKVSFPIARDATEWRNSSFKGHKFLSALPAREVAIFEQIKPYGEGNPKLWALHDLDIARKHRKLVDVDVGPARFRIRGWGVGSYYTPVSTGWVHADGETIFGFLKHDAADYEVEFTPYVAFNAPGLARKPLDASLSDFAALADSIIQLFD